MAGVHKMAAMILLTNVLLFVNCHREGQSESSEYDTNEASAQERASTKFEFERRRSMKQKVSYEGLPIDMPNRRHYVETTTTEPTTTTTTTTTSKDNSSHVPTTAKTINYPKPTKNTRSTIYMIEVTDPDDIPNPTEVKVTPTELPGTNKQSTVIDPITDNKHNDISDITGEITTKLVKEKSKKKHKLRPLDLPGTNKQSAVIDPIINSKDNDISDITNEITTKLVKEKSKKKLKLKDESKKKLKKKKLKNKKRKVKASNKQKSRRNNWVLTEPPVFVSSLNSTKNENKPVSKKPKKMLKKTADLKGVTTPTSSYFYMKPTTHGKGLPQIAVSIGSTDPYAFPQTPDQSHVVKINNLNDVINFFKLAANLKKVQVGTSID